MELGAQSVKMMLYWKSFCFVVQVLNACSC